MNSEFEIIKNIQTHLMSTNHNLIKGIGDDCAVFVKDENTVFVISTDNLVENVHFDFKDFSWIELGKKAMAVNLSDIAAMGAKPLYALVSLSLPPKIQQSQISDLYIGLEHVAQEFSTAIVGGDLSKSPEHLYISLTVVGEVKKAECKYRSGAQTGDGIYVSGTLGTAALGLAGLQKKRKIENHYTQAIKNPRPRLLLANILAECPYVNAMIDVSDGLVQDLQHVMEASQKTAHVQLTHIPHEADFAETCKRLKQNPTEILLTGGEDYQLLFTMDDNGLEDLLGKLEMKRNIKITKIGTVQDASFNKTQSKNNVTVFDAAGNEIQLKKTGFDHFA